MKFTITFAYKTSVHIALVVLGVLAITLSLIMQEISIGNINLSPILFIVGVFSFCWSLPFIFLKFYFNKKPQAKKDGEIKVNDERNIVIKDKARANAGEIIQWFIIGIAFMTLYINAPEWATFVVLGVFVLYKILTIIFMVRYKNKM